jgi:alcohol dehydrogenase (quinone), cytochrome c subunit
MPESLAKTSAARRIALAAAITAAGLATTYGIALLPTHTRPIAASSSIAAPASIGRGRYLAVAADCSACHTAAGGKPFAGGRPIATPVGTIYSTNITPDRDRGIGRFTLDKFDRAVRHGIGAGGETLYPAMPYPSYAKMSDRDLADLFDYFQHGVDAVSSPSRSSGLPWPWSVRWPLALWRKLFAPSVLASSFDASRYDDSVIARGAYLVQGPGHCGACHTPRGFFLQERALDDSSALYLAGGQLIDGWVAVSLRGNAADGLGNWSKSDLIATLRSGHNTAHAVIGAAMGDVVLHSTQYLSDADLLAVASYLKSLPPVPDVASAYAPNPATAEALAAGRETDRGAQLYLDNCSACHRTNGEGSADVFPAIAGNSSVLSSSAQSLILLVLRGSAEPRTAAAPSALGMPGFGWRLSNAEVAQLLSFIRASWGNRASSVSADEVAQVRAASAEPAADAADPARNGPSSTP